MAITATPEIYHPRLKTTFRGIQHPLSSVECLVAQFRGIKYGIIPARFKQSVLNDDYPDIYDASEHGFAFLPASRPLANAEV
jgi:hypothetical protein